MKPAKQPLKLYIALPLLALCTAIGCWFALDSLNQRLATYLPDEPYALSPSEYKKNAHTHQVVEQKSGQYQFSYAFRDQNNIDWIWDWQYPYQRTEDDIAKLGVPEEFFRRYKNTPEERAKRLEILREGLFMMQSGFVKPDFNAIVRYYMPYTKPLYDLLQQTTKGKSWQDKVNLLMKFIQDIPYAVPEGTYRGKQITGVISPPHVLVNAWGDCDSKAALFASVLAHDPQANLLFLTVPNHLLVAVEGVPQPYQSFITHKGKRYILADPVGPVRTMLGQSDYSHFNEVIEINKMTDTLFMPVETGEISARLNEVQSGLVQMQEVSLKDNQLSMLLGSNSNAAMLAELKFEGKKLENQTLIQKVGGRYELLAKYNQAGSYELNIYAKEAGASGPYDLSYTHQFYAAALPNKDIHFPELYAAFSAHNASIKNPLSGELTRGDVHTFAFQAPGATSAAVVSGEEWYHLKQSEQGFEGDVQIQGDTVAIVAKFPKQPKYLYLAEYKVKTGLQSAENLVKQRVLPQQPGLTLISETDVNGARERIYEDNRGKALRLQKVTEYSDYVELVFQSNDDLLLLTELEWNQQTLDNQTFAQKQDQQYQVLLKYDRAGDYKLKLFAKHRNAEGSYPFVFDYRFFAEKAKSHTSAFPEKYNLFDTTRAQLTQPFTGALQQGDRVTFELNAPGAKKIAVHSDAQWHFLKQNGSMFSGDVVVGGTEAVVLANYDGSENFSYLLKYAVNN